MTVYVRVNGIYKPIARPYVQRNGVYLGVSKVFVRKNSAYSQAFLWDVTPPKPPEVSLELIEHRDSKNVLTGRYIKVGIRLTGINNDPTARLVRVLTNHLGGPATNYNGGTWTETPDSSYPGEPWSEWRYNGYGGHGDTSAFVYKQWTPNATVNTDLINDHDYYFTAWALDNHDNWSIPVTASMHVPKASTVGGNVIVKEANFQANTSGSWTSKGFQSGPLIQNDDPRSRGLWFYGNQITDSIGSNSSVVNIRNSQIYIKRSQTDSGAANADIHLCWTPYGTVGDLPTVGGNLVQNDMIKIGTLAKGQGDWFELPDAFHADMANNIKGMSLNYKNYLKAAAGPTDHSEVQQLADNMRCGEIHVVWDEKLNA